VNKAFEFDGTTFAPITTGLNPDAPAHITAHKDYLVIASASSILGSAPGEPFKWTTTDGAWEIATGDTVTGMLTLPGSQSTATLAVFMRSNSAFLYGTDPTTFNFTLFNTGLGALPSSVQNLSDTFFFDDLGIVTMKTTLNYGNFETATLTKNILPFILAERANLTASAVNRSKSQYRTFFSDGYGLYLTMVNQQYLGVGVTLFPNPVFVCDEGETSLGEEVSYFGSNDGQGYVYQLDAGTSFDGADINAYATLAWDPVKSPRVLKRFRNASIEIQAQSYVEVQFGYQLGYGSSNIGQPSPVTYPSSFSPTPTWDSNINWDAGFVWDGQTLSPTDVDLTGTAENIQFTIACSGNYIDAFQVNSIITAFSQRRAMRSPN